MPNKQPFYHRAVILFTATRPLSQAELQKALCLFSAEVLPDSIEVEECDAEPGDPADLI